ncbi:AMIN-like domain-containing (lipo)protein [Arthrobacter sp. B2a2-09]|uniref:AMIN-like domain-containing (lipo)protein n=1 Tax=Arthrobacter sp. B2a2-09 TaxID=2952822 RepID=UPI0022CDB2DD|nr:hypothetical protein [Arthrobacter sp. B2a2-09]MCZ9882633.1 hypothetical protein [Arthrobacter sp. B2a2-09]
MRKFHAWLAALLVAAGLGLVAPGAAFAAPYCGIVWGSLAKSNPALTQAQVVNVRTGQQLCFDRLVIDLNGAVAGYSIRYVPQVLQDGSGLPVDLRGNAFLQVTVNAPAYNSSGSATYNPADKNGLTNVSDYKTFRQVAYAGSFEGYTSLGLGLRSRLPFRVFTLAGPGTGSRLVVDVAHMW